MEASKNGLERILTAVDRLKELDAKAEGAAETCAEQEKMVEVQKLREKFEAAMEDDFNTADAVLLSSSWLNWLTPQQMLPAPSPMFPAC